MSHLCAPGCQHHALDATHQKGRSLWIALILINLFAFVEFSVGWISHSLALVAESGHMLSDGVALALALLATWIARLPASNQATFGYRRVEILAALINGIGLIGISFWIAQEAIERLQAPPEEILSLPMLITAAIGLAVNSINALLLHQDSHTDLNLRGAFWHMVADAISSVGVILAAVLVWVWGWNWADGAISLGVAIFIAFGALPIIRQSIDILLEKTPQHLDLAQIQAHLESFTGVEAVSNLRVWSIALGQDALSAHLTVQTKDGTERDRLLQQLQTSLQQEFGITEIFLQMAAPMLLNLSHPPNLALLLQSTSPEMPESRCSTEA